MDKDKIIEDLRGKLASSEECISKLYTLIREQETTEVVEDFTQRVEGEF